MSATLFALALFGCSDDGTACQRLDAPVQTFDNRGTCTSELEDALASEAARRAEAPSVYAQCLTSRQMAAIGKGEIDLTRVNGVRYASAK